MNIMIGIVSHQSNETVLVLPNQTRGTRLCVHQEEFFIHTNRKKENNPSMVSKKTWPDLQACNILVGRPVPATSRPLKAGPARQCCRAFSSSRRGAWACRGCRRRPPPPQGRQRRKPWAGEMCWWSELSRKGEKTRPCPASRFGFTGRVTTLARAADPGGPHCSGWRCILLGLDYSLV
jgi:hypothetical protein